MAQGARVKLDAEATVLESAKRQRRIAVQVVAHTLHLGDMCSVGTATEKQGHHFSAFNKDHATPNVLFTLLNNLLDRLVEARFVSLSDNIDPRMCSYSGPTWTCCRPDGQ